MVATPLEQQNEEVAHMCVSECCSAPVTSSNPDMPGDAEAAVRSRIGANRAIIGSSAGAMLGTAAATVGPSEPAAKASLPKVCVARRHVLAGAAGVAGTLVWSRMGWAQASRPLPTTAAGCSDLTPALIGGPVPDNASRLTIRWLGCTNYELAYRGQVILLDTYYDRGPRNRPIGFTAEQVRRATAIFIGHGHGDHMSDAVQVATQTGAKVIGAPVSMERAFSGGLPTSQGIMVTGHGGERLRFNGVTVEPILARHSVLSGATIAAFRSAIATVIGPPTPEQAAIEAAIFAKGTSDPRVITEGTIAYLFTFDSGFKVIYRNSAGPITDFEREAMARVGRTDVAIVAYIGQYVAGPQIAVTLPLIELYNPDVFLPAHHDEIAGTFLDIGTEPLFMAVRDTRPTTTCIAPLYRTPVCLNVAARGHRG
jgi:L-ascorbate metabolism protein UlaG (beta-lactamase superfamily)